MAESEHTTDEQEPKEHAAHKPSAWARLPYLVLFVVVFELSKAVVYLVAAVQFVLRLTIGHPNERLQTLGGNVGRYLREIVAFLTYESDVMPFPFGPWPKG